jgi:hypothetical protein
VQFAAQTSNLRDAQTKVIKAFFGTAPGSGAIVYDRRFNDLLTDT